MKQAFKFSLFQTLIVFVIGLILGGLSVFACLNAIKLKSTTAPANTSIQQKEGWYQGTIKAGHLVALDMAPLFVAKEAGYFKEEGLDVETVFFANPGDNNTALAGGSIQFSTNPFTLPFFGENSGLPMRIISSAGGLGIIQVIIQGNYDIKGMENLASWVKSNRHKKLKVASLKGDTLDMILYRSFQKAGLSYDDFEMVWFNDLLAMVQAFETKQVDILSHIQPYTTRLQTELGAHLLTDSNETWGEGTPNCTANVMEEFLQKYPKSVEAYLKAIYRGFDLIVSNPEKATELVVKGNYYRVSPDVLLNAFKHQTRVVLQPNKEGIMQAINDMVKQGYIKEPKTDIFKLDILTSVEKQLQHK